MAGGPGSRPGVRGLPRPRRARRGCRLAGHGVQAVFSRPPRPGVEPGVELRTGPRIPRTGDRQRKAGAGDRTGLAGAGSAAGRGRLPRGRGDGSVRACSTSRSSSILQSPIHDPGEVAGEATSLTAAVSAGARAGAGGGRAHHADVRCARGAVGAKSRRGRWARSWSSGTPAPEHVRRPGCRRGSGGLQHARVTSSRPLSAH